MAKTILMIGLILAIVGCTTTVYRPGTVVPVKKTTVYSEPAVVTSTTMTY